MLVSTGGSARAASTVRPRAAGARGVAGRVLHVEDGSGAMYGRAAGVAGGVSVTARCWMGGHVRGASCQKRQSEGGERRAKQVAKLRLVLFGAGDNNDPAAAFL
jgi:hypothetical protein